MVSDVAYLLVSALVQDEIGNSIPPTTRTAALMALLGILLLGMLIVVVILLGGHWVRRLGSHRRGPAVPPDLIVSKQQEHRDRKPPNATSPTGETYISDETITE